jgi:hypothetical protein
MQESGRSGVIEIAAVDAEPWLRSERAVLPLIKSPNLSRLN